jgi:hypothetical protein
MLRAVLAFFRRPLPKPGKSAEMLTLEQRLEAAEAKVNRETRQYEERLHDRRAVTL